MDLQYQVTGFSLVQYNPRKWTLRCGQLPRKCGQADCGPKGQHITSKQRTRSASHTVLHHHTNLLPKGGQAGGCRWAIFSLPTLHMRIGITKRYAKGLATEQGCTGRECVVLGPKSFIHPVSCSHLFTTPFYMYMLCVIVWITWGFVKSSQDKHSAPKVFLLQNIV